MSADLFEGKAATSGEQIDSLIGVVEIRWNFENVCPSHDDCTVSELFEET